MLDASALLTEAERRAGLNDFGADDFKPGLERLVSSVNRESRLSAAGETAFPELLVGILVKRLQIEDWFKRHPEIDEQEIVDPVFIVGLPRTGSTLLSYLLALDTGTRLIRQWESEQPCPPPIAGDESDPRIAESDVRHDQFVSAMPELKTMVPYGGAAGPVECYELFYPSFDYAHFDMFVHCPSYTSWYLDDAHSHQQAYLYHKRVLKLLQWRCPPRRWVLKMPSHALAIEDLAAVYPDARFIMTHRDPAKVVPSATHLNVTVRRQYLEDAHAIWFGEYSTQIWSLALRRLMAFRDRCEARFHDVYHAQQLVDSVPQMRLLYDWLGWECPADYLSQVSAWRSNNPRQDNLFDAADYGLDKAELTFRFSEYFERFPDVRT